MNVIKFHFYGITANSIRLYNNILKDQKLKFSRWQVTLHIAKKYGVP